MNGQCRLMPSHTDALTVTGPRWARAVLPVAQQVAKQLLHDAQAQSEGQPTGTVRRVRPQLLAARDFARNDPVILRPQRLGRHHPQVATASRVEPNARMAS